VIRKSETLQQGDESGWRHILVLQRRLALRSGAWALCGALHLCAAAGNAADLVHGLWVWKSQAVLEAPRGAHALLQFCESESINEVYVSVAEDPRTLALSGEQQIAHLMALLHRANIRVEALLSSVDADEPGKHRDKLVGRVRGIVQFNRRHPRERFDGIHLDVEPHQRPENKGPGNLRFLPDLVSTYGAVRGLAGSAGMTVNADIPSKYLKGEIGERRMLLSAVPRLTLMLYELSSPEDGESTAQKIGKLQKEARKFLDMAYRGLGHADLARMSIALRTPDYGGLLPAMFKALDETFRGNPRYLGWARHSYNDFTRKAAIQAVFQSALALDPAGA
jgi:hypothetical protein